MSAKAKEPTTQVDLITKVAVLLSVVSLATLVISYIDHLLFYSFFGIPVNNYIQVGEAAVLFLPRFINYIIDIFVVVILCLFFWFILFFAFGESSKNDSNIKKKIKSIKPAKRYALAISIRKFSIHRQLITRSSKQRKNLRKFGYFISSACYLFQIALNVAVLFIGPFLFWAFTSTDRQDDSYKVGILIIWFIFLFIIGSIEYAHAELNALLFEVEKDNVKRAINRFKGITYLFMFIYMQSSFSALNIKRGNPEYNISFSYANKTVKTDDSLVYIGGTQNYIFLRDRKSKNNLIFKMDKIDNCLIRKVEYEYCFKCPFFKG